MSSARTTALWQRGRLGGARKKSTSLSLYEARPCFYDVKYKEYSNRDLRSKVATNTHDVLVKAGGMLLVSHG